ncbi:hypothetical protein JKP88DRAFT_234530 [Tribonema minus]|uniref:Uncharacterized protein n=1 Tax=Tribonema minus TaxID=303371 RepID=A0A836CJZ3_9STRA|nr:hypothetical protein JKP88DRAFT_234530 [Tribonema minus]
MPGASIAALGALACSVSASALLGAGGAASGPRIKCPAPLIERLPAPGGVYRCKMVVTNELLDSWLPELPALRRIGERLAQPDAELYDVLMTGLTRSASSALQMKEKDLEMKEKDLIISAKETELVTRELEAANGLLMRVQGMLHCRGLIEKIEEKGGKKETGRSVWWRGYLKRHPELRDNLIAATSWPEDQLPYDIAAMYSRSSDKIHSTIRTAEDKVVIFVDHWSTAEVACFLQLCKHHKVAPELRRFGVEGEAGDTHNSE